jgi:hypothetical protein
MCLIQGLLLTLYTSSWYSSSVHTFIGEGDFPLTRTTFLTKLFVKCRSGCLRRWIHSGFRTAVPMYTFIHVVLTNRWRHFVFWETCRHYLYCSAPGGKITAIVCTRFDSTFDSCNQMSEISDKLSCLIVI